jgi:hypothetical protein
MSEDDRVMDDEPYGQRIPTAYDVEVLAAMVEADSGGDLLTHTQRNQIRAVLDLFVKSFKDV